MFANKKGFSDEESINFFFFVFWKTISPPLTRLFKEKLYFLCPKHNFYIDTHTRTHAFNSIVKKIFCLYYVIIVCINKIYFKSLEFSHTHTHAYVNLCLGHCHARKKKSLGILLKL